MFINQAEKQTDKKATEFVIVMRNCMTLGSHKKTSAICNQVFQTPGVGKAIPYSET